MGNGIYVALSGAVAQANAFDVAANNVANAGTTGFRAERVRFQEALSRAQRHDAGYVEVAGTVIDPHVGAITTTGNPLDLALTADGHFVVDTPQGVRYTRAGNFRLDAAGTMVSPEGYPVRNREGGHIAIPPGTTSVHIGGDGTVTADDADVGVVEVAKVSTTDLVREGNTMFALRKPLPTEAKLAESQPAFVGPPTPPALSTGPPPTAIRAATGQGGPEVMSGALESANFNAVRGVVDLIRVSRTYETLHRMMDAYKQIDDRAARSLGGK